MKPILVASHMRSGTHLTIDLLRRNLPQVSARYLNLDQLMPVHDEPRSKEDFDRELEGLSGIPLLKCHSPARTDGWFGDDARGRRAAELFEAARTLYVLRDGRDTLVSLFHYMRHYDARVQAQSFAEFLRDRDDFFRACPGFDGLDRVAAWARPVDGWLGAPRAIVVSYEALLSSREATLRGVARRLSLPEPERVEPVPVAAGLPRRLLRKMIAPLRPRHASTAISPRRGVVGDAERYFSTEDDAFFRERAGFVLERLAPAERAS